MLSDVAAKKDEQSLQYNSPVGVLCYSKKMLSRSYRIPKDKFPGVTRGKTVSNDCFRVVFFHDVSLKNSKYAVIVSNKVAKTAVARNKIRRQVYTLIGQCAYDTPPLAYISVYPKKIDVDYQQLEQALKELLCLKK